MTKQEELRMISEAKGTLNAIKKDWYDSENGGYWNSSGRFESLALRVLDSYKAGKITNMEGMIVFRAVFKAYHNFVLFSLRQQTWEVE